MSSTKLLSVFFVICCLFTYFLSIDYDELVLENTKSIEELDIEQTILENSLATLNPIEKQIIQKRISELELGIYNLYKERETLTKLANSRRNAALSYRRDEYYCSYDPLSFDCY